MKSNRLLIVSLTSIFLCCLIISCEKDKKEIIEGDLTFKSITFKSAYGASKEQYDSLITKMDSALKDDNGSEEVKLYKYFKKLQENGLLTKPYIFLKVNKDSVLTLYLSEKEFKKVKNYKHIDLVKESKKVQLKIEYSVIGNDLYYSDNIIDVKKVLGNSRSNLK